MVKDFGDNCGINPTPLLSSHCPSGKGQYIQSNHVTIRAPQIELYYRLCLETQKVFLLPSPFLDKISVAGREL